MRGLVHWWLLGLVYVVISPRAALAQQCRLCENGTYCFLETLFVCPLNSRSLPGSGHITDCVCIAGFFATADHVCRPCEPGSFCPGDESLQSCPSNSFSDVFATSAADCFCVPGFSGASVACAACLPGSAKHGNGSAACVLCAAGSFQALSAASVCVTCPLHTNTPGRTGSVAAAACVSNPGYFNNISVITACAPGTFQPLANQTGCVDCRRGDPENRFYTLENASTSDLACLGCPDYSEVLGSVSGHGLLSCLCSAGFSGSNGGQCAACAAGSVKAGAGSHACAACLANQYANPANTLCVPCTGNSTSSAASDSRSACVCAAGFALNPLAPFDCQECAAGQRAIFSGGLPVCEACPVGQYNNLRRQTACVVCPANEYQPAIGQLACLACPSSSVSLAGAVQRSECACLPGFARVVDECRMCLPGSYKNAPDNTACLPCAAGQTSANASTSAVQCQDCAPLFLATTPGGLVCQACATNAVAPLGGVGLSTCQCAPGFTGPAGNCVSCASGTFKPLPGSHMCTRCAPGFAGVNASGPMRTSNATCVVCAANTYEEKFFCRACPSFASSVSGSDSVHLCVCEAGYASSSVDAETLRNSIRPFRDYETNATAKSGVSGWRLTRFLPETATRWHQAMDSLRGTDVYGLNSGTAAIMAGSWSVLFGEFDEFFISNVPMTKWIYCTRAAVDDSDVTVGYSLEARPIMRSSAYPQGPSYTAQWIRSQSAAYPWLSVTNYGNTPEDFVYIPNKYNMKLDRGGLVFVRSSTYEALSDLYPCVTCDAGLFKPASGNVACTLCGNNTYSEEVAATNASTCLACPANTAQVGQARDDISTCVCRRGYGANQSGVACAACPDGSFQASAASVACTPCAANTFQPYSASVHDADTCAQCPLNSTSGSGSSTVAACVCDSRFNRNGSACALCRTDHFCPDQDTVTACPTHMTAPRGAIAVSECACVLGFSRVGNTCQLCAVNTYCANGVVESACPGNSTTHGQPGRTNRSACVCNSGFYEADGVEGNCSLCGANTFCANDRQLACPPNSSAPAGAGSEAECLCDALFKRQGLVCARCPASEVCVAGGVASQSCAAGASNVNQLCKCAAGSYCSLNGAASCLDSNACLACEAGSYCANNLQTVCKAGSHSLANSSSAAACLCVAGNFLNGAGACEACPVGSYCFDEGQTQCITHDARLTTAGTGAASKDECVCAAGDFRLTLTDLCKPCPRHFFCPVESAAEMPNVVACAAGAFTSARGMALASDCQACAAERVFDRETPGECVCRRGSEASANDSCTPCLSPLMKANNTNTQCQPCAADFEWRNATSCVACPLHATAAVGGVCVCTGPRVRQGQVCQACASDSYLEAATAQCVSCPAFSSTRGAANVATMPAIDSCVCDPGYVRGQSQGNASAHCVACAAGTFSLNGLCTACPFGATSNALSANASACVCDTTSCKVAVWRSQTCAGECEHAPEPCDECEPGNFKAGVSSEGNTQQCEPCAVHTFQEEAGAATCVACHSSRHTLEGGVSSADECQCVAGFEDVPGDEACEICLAGHFKAERGDYGCSACALGSFSAHDGATTCLACTEHAPIRHANTTAHMASSSAHNCTCDKGFFLAATGCEPCAIGSFKDHAGLAACLFCGSTILNSSALHNTYGAGPAAATSHAHCAACPLFSGQDHAVVSALAPMRSRADCLCFPGHDTFDSVTGCAVCEAYEVKLGFNNGSCAFCAAGHVYTSGYQPCVPCALTQVASSRVHRLLAINTVNASLLWASNQLDCACELGHFRVEDQCHECALGSFRNQHTAAECAACPLHSFANETATLECHACPANSFTDSNASTSIQLCVCAAGYEWHAAQLVCRACEPGFFNAAAGGTCGVCASGSYSTLPAQTACVPCATHEISLLPRSAEESCVCSAGSGGPAVCAPCAHASHSPGGQAGSRRPECLSCPNFKNTSETASTSVGDCLCVAGHGDNASNAEPSAACAPCVSGQFARGGANLPCQKCGFGAVTDPPLGATAFEQCMCDAQRGLRIAH